MSKLKKVSSNLSVFAMVMCALAPVLLKAQIKFPKLPKELKKNFAWIQDGYFHENGDSSFVSGFFISKTEVKWDEYREFIKSLTSKSGGDSQLAIAAIDTNDLQIPFIKWYCSHPAFGSYPVVLISQEAASLYCQWLTEKYRTQLGEDFYFDLPYRKEWVRAANSGGKQSWYAWGGPYLVNQKGIQLCNYNEIPQIRVTLSDDKLVVLDESIDGFYELKGDMHILPSLSFYPNKSGLYNMNGNVAEWVKEPNVAVGGSFKSPGFDVRNESFRIAPTPANDIGFRVIIRRVQGTDMGSKLSGFF